MSKLIALKEKGIEIPIKKGEKVLYLGASHGVTPKLVSNIVGKKGLVFCLEISRTVMKDLLKLCENNENMAPLLFDANDPEQYNKYIPKVDVIYQDLAQRDQVNILLKNIRFFLKKGGYFILLIKSRSVDVIKSTEEIRKKVKENLKGFKALEFIDISDTHKGHFAIIGKN